MQPLLGCSGLGRFRGLRRGDVKPSMEGKVPGSYLEEIMTTILIIVVLFLLLGGGGYYGYRGRR